ncbi:MAG: hypothetical protein UHW86_11225 [Spirochaetota bacterium]|jgi:hypothetical protein|nr:hypothetical protein [Spirochaetota bacterium]
MLTDTEIEIVLSKIKEQIYIANRTGTLFELLREWQIEIPNSSNNINEENKEKFVSNPFGKILIIGESSVKQNHILGLIKECFGLDNKEALKKFNLKLNYDDILHFNCEKINKNSYSVILAGPMPHSAPGKSDSSSVLANLEKNENGSYPPVYRLMDSSGQLKITKENIKEKINELIKNGVVNI